MANSRLLTLCLVACVVLVILFGFDWLMVFLAAVGLPMTLVRGKQAYPLRRHAEPSRSWWFATLTAIPVYIVWGYYNSRELPTGGVATAVVSGIVVAIIALLRFKPSWSATSESGRIT
jgi:FtsH-binding integral membrane protein